jgi:tRNA (cytosine49-C5)-methyltransferase
MSKTTPSHEKIEFKEKFIERYTSLTDFEEFKKYSLQFVRKAIRVNTLKISVPELKKRLQKEWKLTQVPWCREGFWIEHGAKEEEKKRRDIGNLPEHVLGYIYSQEAASMLPPLVLQPQPGETVLDMCAAPGSKTTQLGQYMKDQGLLVANDADYKRIASLALNVQRCGLTNTVITHMQGHRFKYCNMQFDKILLDAPCSGTGTICKSYRAVLDWSPNLVKKLAGLQKQLIQVTFGLLKPGGIMVYSTCTCEPEENEGVVSYLLEKEKTAQLKPITLAIKKSEPFKEFEGVTFAPDIHKCLRIWPQDNNTEGFFVAKIEKKK